MLKIWIKCFLVVFILTSPVWAYEMDVNFALDGTATQSSTNEPWGTAEDAIDDDPTTHSHTATPGTDGWLEVDLGDSYDLDKIELLNRGNCCWNRLNGVVLKVLDAGRSEIYVGTAISGISNSGPAQLIVDDNSGAGFTGVRYIRLEQSTNEYLSVAEVRAIATVQLDVIPPNSNLMKIVDGMVTVQSPTSPWGEPEDAIDGNINTMSHTGDGPDSFWMVDLTDRFNISSIEIDNRLTEPSTRMTNLTIRVLDENMNSVYSSVVTETVALGETITRVLPTGIQGQYIRVGLEDGAVNAQGNSYINLPEVRAFGSSEIGRATDPTPADGTPDISTTTDLTLTWQAGDDPNVTGHFVYFSDSPEPNDFVLQNTTVLPLATTSFVIGNTMLDKDITYYWRVDEELLNGGAGSVAKGYAWSFDSEKSLPQVDPTTPEDQFVKVGEDAVFVVDASDPLGGTLTYNWYYDPNLLGTGDEVLLSDGLEYSIADNSLTVLSVDTGDAGYYYCEVSNASAIPVVSRTASLTLQEMIGYWPFDGDVTDAVGSNDGTTGVSNYVAGKVGQAIRFEDAGGNPDRTEADAVKILTTPYDGEFVGAFSISWWEMTEADANRDDWDTMVGLGYGDFQQALYKGTNPDIHYWNLYGGGGYTDGQGEWIDRMPSYQRYDVWHMHVVTFDGERFRKYINGMEIPSQILEIEGLTDFNTTLFNATMSSLPNPIWVGNEDDQYGTFNNGLDAAIDELKLFNYVKDADEVAQDYVDIAGGTVCQLSPGHTTAHDIMIDAQILDFNRDCVVDISDLSDVVDEWLECTLYPAEACP